MHLSSDDKLRKSAAMTIDAVNFVASFEHADFLANRFHDAAAASFA